MSHVFAARALVPGMLARGSGYLLNTASAAGLLAPRSGSMLTASPKNAAVALASISPLDMATAASAFPCCVRNRCDAPTSCPSAARVDGVLQPPEVARMVLAAMEAEQFLILTPSAGPGIHAAQGIEPRPLADRHAAAARQDLWRVSLTRWV